ncbi:MAG: hypothetical protein JWO24_3608 [Rhodospirillales bacterium]|jgi:hypothetical protein|nr:hypothetical protein [Rhodospirillales bacterium]
MDDLQNRFRSEFEREMEERWLASSLAEWMETHHGEAAELLGHKRMDWGMVAQALGAHGLTGPAGQPPTAESARETWKRVEARRRPGMKLRKAKG